MNGEHSYIHKNSHIVKMQQLYEQLAPDEQRVILRQVKILTGQHWTGGDNYAIKYYCQYSNAD